MVSNPLNFKNPLAKSCAEAAKPRKDFAKKIQANGRLRGFGTLLQGLRRRLPSLRPVSRIQEPGHPLLDLHDDQPDDAQLAALSEASELANERM